MRDDLVARLCSPEEIVFPAGTKITLDNGKTMELLEPFSMWSSGSDKHDAAAEIVLLRVENDHLKQARSDALAGGDALREEITRLRASVEALEKVRAAAQALAGYEFGWLGWEEKLETLRVALKEAKP